jgi:hypothetical protein
MPVSFDDIKDVRIKINDPAGVIHIEEVSDSTHLPSAPKKQYIYYTISDEKYLSTEVESGAVPGDYKQVDLLVADDAIAALITASGVDTAVYRTIRLIMSKLGQQIRLASISSGRESQTYTSLKELYDYYKDLAEVYKLQGAENVKQSTGLYGRVKRGHFDRHHDDIGGGNL